MKLPSDWPQLVAIATLSALTTISVILPEPELPMRWSLSSALDDGSGEVYVDTNSIRILDTGWGMIKQFNVLIYTDQVLIKHYVIACDPARAASPVSWEYSGRVMPSRGDPISRVVTNKDASILDFPTESNVYEAVCLPKTINVIHP